MIRPPPFSSRQVSFKPRLNVYLRFLGTVTHGQLRCNLSVTQRPQKREFFTKKNLLDTGENFLSMRIYMDLGKDMGDQTVLPDDIGNTARKTSAPSPIHFAEDMGRIAEEREAEASVVSKSFVVRNRIKAGPENLHVALREGVIEDEEPTPLGGSPAGVGFGIKPQDHLFAAEICQAYSGTIVCRHCKIRRL
jgi:hypothetical protein